MVATTMNPGVNRPPAVERLAPTISIPIVASTRMWLAVSDRIAAAWTRARRCRGRWRVQRAERLRRQPSALSHSAAVPKGSVGEVGTLRVSASPRLRVSNSPTLQLSNSSTFFGHAPCLAQPYWRHRRGVPYKTTALKPGRVQQSFRTECQTQPHNPSTHRNPGFRVAAKWAI